MLSYPIGVQELLGYPAMPGPVLPGAWLNFCYKTQAEQMLAKVQESFPGCSISLVDASENPFVWNTTDPALVPRIWIIQGNDGSGNVISELAGFLIDRQTKPNPFVDGSGGPNLKAKVFYGIAQLYWGN